MHVLELGADGAEGIYLGRLLRLLRNVTNSVFVAHGGPAVMRRRRRSGLKGGVGRGGLGRGGLARGG